MPDSQLPPAQNEDGVGSLFSLMLLFLFAGCCGLLGAGRPNYEDWLYSTLTLTFCAAFVQLCLAFQSKSVLLPLGSAMLLSTVVAPIITNKLSLGVRVGSLLWLANASYFVMLLIRWGMKRDEDAAGWSVLVAALGALAFGSHVIVFAAIP